ncbi:MAG TPA: DUF6600 domain-containing protein [Steroidobacteraceae bacterium]|nr:DUF6600 domain-containing protein [Steroidobacteraceae bacterium]
MRRLAWLILLACGTHAAAYGDDTDPPGRAARLSAVEGSVSLQPAGVADWTAATLNRPLTSGDRMWTDQSSRAELDLGGAVIRLGSTTGFAFLGLDDAVAQMQLTGGTLIVRVRNMDAGQVYEIDTPNLALSLQQPGDYRVEVNPRGDATVVKVSDGAVQAVGGGQTVAIGDQQQVVFSGTTQLAYDARNLGPPDDLDGWSTTREQQVEDAASAQYMPSDVPGTQDLDNNGTWQETPEYGYVWTPTTVSVGWAPYRYGRWMWVTPWGWTWVDAAPWGYAPFHYGRWFPCHDSWCWVPGPRRMRPVYAPALVAWVGAPTAGAPGAFGSNVGWFPLGPNEVYVPPYRVSRGYARIVNVSNTRLVSNTYITHIYEQTGPPPHYTNNRVDAVTSVPQSVFTSAQPVGAHAVRLAPALLTASLVTAAAPAVPPSRQSVLGPSESRGISRPPAALLQRSVVAHRPPPRAPVPFDDQLAAIEANGGRPLARGELARLQPATADASVRAVAIAGPVVHAGAAQPAVAGGRAAVAPPPAASAASTFAERERILQHPQIPAPPDASSARPRANAFVPPELPRAVPYVPEPGSERREPPPAAPTAQPRAFNADGATHAPGSPATLPVYAPPVTPDVGQPENEPHASAPTYRAPAATPRAAAPATQRLPPPPPGQPPASSARGARDSAAHGDRESRERVER